MTPSTGCLFDLLTQLNTEERQRFDAAAHALRVGKGQTVIGQGPGGTDVFFIEEGALQVLMYSRSGKQVSIRTLRKGEFFGELAAVDGSTRSANVVALSDARLVRIEGPAFRSLLQTSAAASFWMNLHLTGQVRTLTERIFELSALNVRSRLHCELLRLGVQAGVKENEARIRPSPTHVELANRIGTHREGVTREVRALVQQGLLQQMRRELIVRDIAELSRLVRSAVGEHARALPKKRSSDDVPPAPGSRRASDFN